MEVVILDRLKEIGMLGCKPIYIIMDVNVKLKIKGECYHWQRLIIGKLIYLTHTKFDIFFFLTNFKIKS